MAKKESAPKIFGSTKEFNRTLEKGNDSSKWNQKPVEVTADMIVTPANEIMTEAWYLAARKAVTDSETTDPAEAQKIFENYILGANDVRTIHAGDVSDTLEKALRAASAEELAALKVRFID